MPIATDSVVVQWVQEGFEEFIQNMVDQGATIDQVGQAIDSLAQKQEELGNATEDSGKKAESATKKQKGLTDAFKEGIRDISVYGISIGDVEKKLGQLGNTMGITTKNSGSLIKSLGGLTKAGVAGLVIAALGALLLVVTKTQGGMDKMSQVTAGLSAGLGALANRVGGLVDAIKNLSFSQFLSEVKEAAADMKDAAERGAAYEKSLQGLKKATLEFRLENAKVRTQIKELNKLGEDTTKSDQVRAKAIREAIALEKGLIKEKVTRIQQEQLIVDLQKTLPGNSDSISIPRKASRVRRTIASGKAGVN